MRPTVPWISIQFWKAHPVAAVIGLAPSLVVLTLQRGAIADAPLIGALMTVIGWLIFGSALAFLLASRRWVLASIGFAIAGVFVLAWLPGPAVVVSNVDRNVPAIRDDGPITGGGGAAPPPKPVTPGIDDKVSGNQPPTASAPTGSATQPPKPVNLDPFREYSKQLVNGVVGFDYSPTMTVGDRAEVRLRVSVQKAVEELRASLKREGRESIVEPVKVAPKMKAELRGFGFDIKTRNSTEQLVDADEDTTWTWDVRATEAGKQRLTVTLTAVVLIGDSLEGGRDVSTFYREVEVEATPKDWWENARQVAQEYGPSRDVVWPSIPAAIAALWAFLFARRQVKKRRTRR